MQISELVPYLTHFGAVRRFKFNKRLSKSDADEFTVASCANDHSVRIFRVNFS